MSTTWTWNDAKQHIREELGSLRTRGWLDEVELAEQRGPKCSLVSGSSAARQRAEHFRDAITSVLSRLEGNPVEVRVQNRSKRTTRRRAAARKRAEAPTAQLRETFDSDPLHPDHRFRSFLVGPNTEVPLRFAQHVIDQPGRYSPLVIHGPTASGKSHLLQAATAAYRRRYPARRAIYVHADRFARQFSDTARKRLGAAFRDFYRDTDLLVIDDLHQLAGKPGTERELVRTLDTLLTSDRQVICASLDPPNRLLPRLHPALEGRLMGGVVCPLRAPDANARREIIRARFLAARLPQDPHVTELLLSGLPDLRDLLAGLTRLEAFARHMRIPPNVRIVRQILSDQLGPPPEPASVQSITTWVAERLGVEPERVIGRGRQHSLVQARQVAMGLCRELTPLTLREVGAHFGDRSCASVHFAQQRAAELREQDPLIQSLWDEAHDRFPAPVPELDA